MRGPIFAADWREGSVNATPATNRATANPRLAVSPARKRLRKPMPVGSGKPIRSANPREREDAGDLTDEEAEQHRDRPVADLGERNPRVGAAESEESQVHRELEAVLERVEGVAQLEPGPGLGERPEIRPPARHEGNDRHQRQRGVQVSQGQTRTS